MAGIDNPAPLALSERELHALDAHWHAANYLAVGQIDLTANPLLRNLDRYRLVMDVIYRVPGLAVRAAAVRQQMADQRLRHHDWIREHGTDLPEITDWTWTA